MVTLNTIFSIVQLSCNKEIEHKEIKTRDRCHDKSEVFSNHMAQVQICDYTTLNIPISKPHLKATEG